MEQGQGLNQLDLVHLRPYLEGFFDPVWLSSEIAEYRAWSETETDSLFQWDYLDRPPETNLLVAGIAVARDWEREWNADKTRPNGRLLRILQIAFNLAVTEYYSDGLMDEPARKHLQERLQDGSGGLWAVIHETETFMYYRSKGINAIPYFLSNSNPREIDLIWKGEIIPIQCKRKSQGTGHFVARDVMVRLGVAIVRDAKLTRRRAIVRISATEKFHPLDIEPIRAKVLDLDIPTATPVDCLVNNRSFRMATETIDGMVRADEERSKARSLGLGTGILVADPPDPDRPDRFVAAVSLTSDSDDGDRGVTLMLRTLRKSLNEAARQLSQGHPGVAAIHYFDGTLPFDPDRPFPRRMGKMLHEWLGEHPEVRAILLTTEPDFQNPNATGKSKARLYDPFDRLPADFPKGMPFA